MFAAVFLKSTSIPMEERFKDLSPVSFANKINVPVLVLHGNNDRLVLPDHAWKMAEALFLHQKEHDIVVLYSPEEDTGHNLKGKALEEAHSVHSPLRVGPGARPDHHPAPLHGYQQHRLRCPWG